MKSKILFLLCLFAALSVSAQDMATQFRSEGKIYVVVAVAAVVLVGIFTYLILMDLRLKKLEKEVKEGPKN